MRKISTLSYEIKLSEDSEKRERERERENISFKPEKETNGI